MLIKNLIAYHKTDLIHMIMNNFERINQKQAKQFGVSGLMSGKIAESINSSQSVIRNFVLELIFGIIDNDQVFLFDDILDRYSTFIENKTIPIVNRMVQSIENQFENKHSITSPDYKFKIIRKLCKLGAADMKTIQDLTNLLKKLIEQEPKINFLTSCYNPIKIFIDIIRMMMKFGEIVHNFDEDIKILIKEYEKLIIRIIEERESSDHLRNWLYEDYNHTFKVLDYI